MTGTGGVLELDLVICYSQVWVWWKSGEDWTVSIPPMADGAEGRQGHFLLALGCSLSANQRQPSRIWEGGLGR